MRVTFVNTFTGLIQATDPELTPEEQAELDDMVEADLEHQRERKDGRSREMVEAVDSVTPR